MLSRLIPFRLIDPEVDAFKEEVPESLVETDKPTELTEEELIDRNLNQSNEEGDHNYDLIIDPDEDPEVAAFIDSQLEQNNKNQESEKPKPPYLPPIEGGLEFTLVLDLDETLIHFREEDDQYLVRPGVHQFLEELSQFYEIVVFTASVKDYADFILDQVDERGFIKHRLYRRHTMFKDAMYIKDLSLLGRDLKKTIIIDNLYESFLNQPENGILCKSWYDDMEDSELLTLLPFLKGLVEDRIEDIREILAKIMNS